MQQFDQCLAHKLLADLHLSVPERVSLPNGKMPFSALVRAVENSLSDKHWFPFQPEDGEDIGDRAVIEARGDEIWVHEQSEVGIMRYSPVKSFQVSNFAAAVRAYVAALGCDTIDGVEIDWHA